MLNVSELEKGKEGGEFWERGFKYSSQIQFASNQMTWGFNGRSTLIRLLIGSACGVIVIVVGNEHGDTSSNPGRDWLHFT